MALSQSTTVEIIRLSADEDIVRAFCEKGLKTYNNGYLGPTTCETVWFLPRTYEKKIKNLELVCEDRSG